MKKIIAFACMLALLAGCVNAVAEIPFVIDYSIDANDPCFDPENITPRENSPLAGKTVYWLGSSEVVGEMAEGISMVEYLAVRNGMTCVKDAVSGSTLKSMPDNQDYVHRLIASEVFDPNAQIDAFICTISTNDAIAKKKWGTVTEEDVLNREQFDLDTSMGAVEFIISYVHDTWHCPVYFFSGSYYGSKEVNGYVRDAFWNPGKDYKKLVAAVQEAVDKWNAVEGYEVAVIDMYNDAAFNSSLTTEEFHYLMNKIQRGDGTVNDDPIHPLKAGYLYWWTPYFEAFLEEHLQ